MASSAPDTSALPSYEIFLGSMQALGATREGGITLERASRRFTAVWHTPGRSTPPSIRFTTSAGPLVAPPVAKVPPAMLGGPFRSAKRERLKSPAPLTLRLEGTLDRAGKSLRLNREIQTGDAAFDERIYVESEAPDALVLAVLASPVTRAGVLACLTLGCTEIKLDDDGTLGADLPLTNETAVTPGHLTSVLDALGETAESIPPLRGEGHHHTRVGSIPVVAGVGTLVSWPLFYLVDWIWEPFGSDLYATAALAGLGLWIVSLPVFFFVLRGRSVSLRDFLTTAIALAIGFPLGATDLLLTLNGALDTSPVDIHATRIEGMRRTTGKNASSYITVDNWHPGGGTIQLQIGSNLYSTLAVNEPITITTRRGFLGWERILAIVPTEPQTSN